MSKSLKLQGPNNKNVYYFLYFLAWPWILLNSYHHWKITKILLWAKKNDWYWIFYFCITNEIKNITKIIMAKTKKIRKIKIIRIITKKKIITNINSWTKIMKDRVQSIIRFNNVYIYNNLTFYLTLLIEIEQL